MDSNNVIICVSQVQLMVLISVFSHPNCLKKNRYLLTDSVFYNCQLCMDQNSITYLCSSPLTWYCSLPFLCHGLQGKGLLLPNKVLFHVHSVTICPNPVLGGSRLPNSLYEQQNKTKKRKKKRTTTSSDFFFITEAC